MMYAGVAVDTAAADNPAAAASMVDENLPMIITGIVAALVVLSFIVFTYLGRIKGRKSFYSALLKAQSAVGEGVMIVEGQDITYANTAMETLSGYRKSELLSMPSILNLISIEERDKVMNSIHASQLNSELATRYEIGLINNAGYRLDVEFAISGFTHRSKHRTLIICLDISERKRALESLQSLNESLEESIQVRTEELNKERQFIETILNIAGALVVVLDNDGRIIRFNGACEQLSLYNFDELQQKYFWDCLISPDNKPRLKEKILELLHSPGTSSFTFEWVIRSREPRLITWYTGVLTDEQGEVQNIILTGIDVTEFRLAKAALIKANTDLKATVESLQETRDQLLQAEKMATLGGQVAAISSELAAPLESGIQQVSAWQTQLSALRQNTGLESVISRNRQLTDTLLQNLQRAATLVNSVHRVAVDQDSESWRTVEIRPCLDDILTSLQPQLNTRGIRVDNRFPAGISTYTSPGVMYQVVSNLVLNSLAHAFHQARAGSIVIDGGLLDKRISLGYEDNGRGIPAEDRNKVFDPFVSTRDGSGLGLYIVHKLVAEALKGTISLEHKRGPGVRFEISFPQRAEALVLDSVINQR